MTVARTDLDPATLNACAEIARKTAEAIAPSRAHFNVVAAALIVLAETFENLAQGGEG